MNGHEHSRLGAAVIDALLLSLIFVGSWVAAPSLAVTTAGTGILVLPLRAMRRSAEERTFRVLLAMSFVPGLALASVSALACAAYPILSPVLAMLPIVLWMIAALVVGILGDRTHGPPMQVWTGWRRTAVAGGVTLVVLLVAVTARDWHRHPLATAAEYWASLDPPVAPIALVGQDNPCAQRTDLPACRYVLQDDVCFGVLTNGVGTALGAGDFDHAPAWEPIAICPRVAARRDPGSGHIAVEMLDDVPSTAGLSTGMSGSRSLLPLVGPTSKLALDTWDALAAWDFLGEMSTPSSWKVAGLGGALTVAAVVGLSSWRRRRQQEARRNETSPYRASAEEPGWTIARDSEALRHRFAFLVVLAAICPLGVAAAIERARDAPTFRSGVQIKAVMSSKALGRDTPCALFIDSQPGGANVLLDGSGVRRTSLGPTPRWGVQVTPGRHEITVGAKVVEVMLNAGDARRIEIVLDQP